MSRVTLESGIEFGAYRVERLLGAGAFGAVYEATNLKLDKPVALKVLHADVAKNAEASSRFVQEAKTVARIRHPHIVDIYDVDTVAEGALAGVPYLAMELLAGESLAARCGRAKPMSMQAALDVMLPVISAVNEVHRRGIVHRDIKPDNVFLTEVSGRAHPKLLDFGIAKVRSGCTFQTIENAAIGTPAYSSPEQMTDAGSVGPESDQWSLAVTLFQCLTGTLPFDTKTGGLQGLIVRLCTADPTPLRSLRPDLPPALEGVIQRALRKERGERFPTTASFGAALLPFASAAASERFAADFGVASAPTNTLPLHSPAAVERPLSLGPAGVSRESGARDSSASSGVGGTPGSLLGVSAAITPPMHRPRWGTAVAMALAVAVLGSALGLGAARLRPGRATTAPRVPVTAVPVVLPPAPEPPPEVAPVAAPAPSDIAAPTPPPAANARRAPTPQHRPRRSRSDDAHAEPPRRHPSAPTTQPRTGIPIIE